MKTDERAYVTLDDPLLLNLAKTDPALFLSRFPPPVIIDEIQYAPELLPHIKMEADSTGKPGLFWLTGSQHFHLIKGVSESLAGRVGIVRMLGLSRREAENAGHDSLPFMPDPGLIPNRIASGGALGLKELYRLIWRGSFPAVALNPGMDWGLFYSSYVETYLKRDVRDLARVGDEAAFFARFLHLVRSHLGRQDEAGRFAKLLDAEMDCLWVFLEEDGVDPTNIAASVSCVSVCSCAK